MSGVLERTLGILETLATAPQGLPLATLADRLAMPRSGCHRLLADLMRLGWVRQTRDHGDYALTLRMTALGLGHLAATGVTDIAQPLLDRLAEATGELARLSVWQEETLTWVAKAQGARSGLRYDPDQGQVARLSCSAAGQAILSTMSDEQALMLVARQGFGRPDAFGPNAPTTAKALVAALAESRARGYSVTIETFTAGMTALAAPIVAPDGTLVGAISVAGPCVRFGADRIAAVGAELVAAAAELGIAGAASPLFRRRAPTPA